MKKRILAAILCGILLGGCGNQTVQDKSEDNITAGSVKGESEPQKETPVIQPVEEKVFLAGMTLSEIRETLQKSGMMFAYAYLNGNEIRPELPANQVIGTAGDCYCIIPGDLDAAVTIDYRGKEKDTEILYQKDKGDPILLYSESDSGIYMGLTVTVSDGEQTVSWTPYVDEYGYVEPPVTEDWDWLALDLTDYSWMDVPGESPDYSGAETPEEREALLMEELRESGGYVPSADDLADSQWFLGAYYLILNREQGGELWEGSAYIGETGMDASSITDYYAGSWSIEDGMLKLDLENQNGEGRCQDRFPVLIFADGVSLYIGTGEAGSVLLFQEPYMDKGYAAVSLLREEGQG